MSSSSNELAKQTSKLSFQDLPLETQKQIISHVGRRDLFALQIVSRHFHGLASAEIYRSLDFNIISSEAEDMGNSPSRAADALQTILASDYDYGQHIKSFRMGAVADRYMAGSHGRHQSAYDDQLLMTRLLWDSKTDPSKFLNTALLLMARKASILETFKWDAPIELSNAVYQALHKVKSLRHLLIRLDLQPSPRIIQRQSHHPPPPGIPPGPFPPAAMPSTTFQTYTPGFDSSISKRRKVGGSKFWAKRWAFSGFRYLCTLEVVGFSNLDCLSEVAQCIKASSATLKSLTLTLSSELARKARKPTTTTTHPLDEDISDTELDDDDIMDIPTGTMPSASHPANEADIREEKMAQENILATVFNLQSVAQVGKKLEKRLSLAVGKCLEEEDAQAGVEELFAELESLKDSPLEVEQAKKMKTYLDVFIKSQLSHAKKPANWIYKPEEKTKIKEAHKALKKQKHSMNAGVMPFTPSGLSNEFTNNVLGFNDIPPLPPKASDINNHEPWISPPYGVSSTSGKSSGYGFPGASNYGGGSSSIDLPSIISSPIPVMKTGKPSNGDYSSYPSSAYTVAGPNALSYLSYPQSHASSGSLTPTIHTGLYEPHTGGAGNYSGQMYSPPFSNVYPIKSPNSFGKKSKQPKPKKHVPKKAGPPKPVAFPSSDDSEGDIQIQPKLPSSSDAEMFFGKNNDPPVESMDVDVDHPDEDMSDLGEDQEYDLDPISFTEKQPYISEPSSFNSSSVKTDETIPSSSSIEPAPVELEPVASEPSAAEAMQDYIRVTHGLGLEELRLHWIPLKASIVGRALDLTVLKRITLLEVGPQDTFWALLVRLTSLDNKIAFKSIHTDHVSKSFTKFLGSFDGLEELFLHERSAKESDTDPELMVDVTSLRKTALSNHVSTLRKLMLRNERNDCWDVDTKTLQFLALKAKSLTELACSMKMQTYHILIQMFSAFSSLHALHLITLRSTDRNPMLQIESLNFAVDSLAHCPGVKLRYLALGEQVNSLETRPDSMRKQLKRMMEHEKDRKGKGKAVDFVPSPTDKDDDGSEKEFEDGFWGDGEGGRRHRFSTRFDDVKGVKIFAREVRTGRL